MFADIPFNVSMLPENIQRIDTEIAHDSELTPRIKNFIAEGVASVHQRADENGATIAEIAIMSSHQIDSLGKYSFLPPAGMIVPDGEIPEVLKNLLKMFGEIQSPKKDEDVDGLI